MQRTKLKAIDFFCSGGGMTYGMSKAGIDVIAGIDIDVNCKATYEINNSKSIFINIDIHDLKERCLQNLLNLKINDDNLLLIGCSPCQYWTNIRTKKDKSKITKNLITEFQRFVNYFNPGFIVIENVPGVEKKKEESGLSEFIVNLQSRGFKVLSKILNLNEYGVPQTRKRFILIASRLNFNINFPIPSKQILKVKDFLGEWNGFPQINAGHKDNSDRIHSAPNLNYKNLQRLIQTSKNGGNSYWWRKDKNLGKTKYFGEGFKDNYSRMSWDKPAPTITTKFFSISNGRFAHPDENRAISLREGATLQTFPKSYKFCSSSIQGIARMIGNAVPPEFAKRLGKTIISISKK